MDGPQVVLPYTFGLAITPVFPEGAQALGGYPAVTSITNADQGVVFSWRLADLADENYCADSIITNAFIYGFVSPPGPVTRCVTPANLPAENHLTTVTKNAGISDVVWQDAVAGQNSAVQPVLQLADGSCVGGVSDSSGNQDMVAFDASGNVKWSVPGYNPDIATADGGIIADTGNGYYIGSTPGPASTFDALGNATGELANLPTYSWKAAYQLGTVEDVLPDFDLANIATTTFAAVRGGNLTGNGFALRHHTFGLAFCNTGVGGDGACTSGIQITPMSFSYLAGIADSNYTNICDFSASSPCDNYTAHPDWVNTIKNGALKAYTAAFAKLPAIVSNKVAISLLKNSVNPPFDHTAYVDGQWFLNEGPGCPRTGDTHGSTFSWVYYLSVLCSAEGSLGPYGSSPLFTPPITDTANMQKLVTAIGRGIGDTAAHETGHQISFSAALPGLDCGPGSDKPPSGYKACTNNVNSVYESATEGGWFYLDWTPPINWEQIDIIVLQNYFNCTAQACN